MRYLLVLTLLISCQDRKGKIESEEVVTIKIISPYNCEYHLVTRGTNFSISSLRRDFSKGDILEGDTLKGEPTVETQKVDTLLDESDKNRLLAIMENLRDTKPQIDSRHLWDGYTYELYVDEEKRRRSLAYDKDIYSMIKILRPYIKNEAIQCCQFFELFDNVKNDIE